MYRESTLICEPPLPLLITGISGVAGYNALPYLQERYPGQVIGIRQRDNWRLGGNGIEVCNAEDRAELERLAAQVATLTAAVGKLQTPKPSGTAKPKSAEKNEASYTPRTMGSGG